MVDKKDIPEYHLVVDNSDKDRLTMILYCENKPLGKMVFGKEICKKAIILFMGEIMQEVKQYEK